MVRRMNHVQPHPKSGVYRVRRDFPSHLHAILGCTSRTRSLGTKDVKEANRRAAAVLAEMQRQIDEAEVTYQAQRRGDEPAEVSLTFETGTEVISDWRDERLRRFARAWTRRTQGAGSGAGNSAATAEDHVARWIEGIAKTATYYGPCERLSDARASDLLDQILRERGYVLPAKHALRQPLVGLLQTTATAALATQDRWLKNQWTPEDAAFFSDGDAPARPKSEPCGGTGVRPSAPLPLRQDPIPVTELLERYIARTEPPRQTESEQRLAVKRFLDSVGADLFVHEVNYADTETFYKILLSLPAGMTPAQAAMPVTELAAQMSAGLIDKPTIKRQTADKQIALLAAMFRWGQSRGYTDIEPFRQLTSPRKAQAKRRLPFSENDINKIFTSPLFVGCVDTKRWREKGTYLVADNRFWIPLLGLVTGMRIEEIGQLLVTDIKTDAGIRYLDITEDVEAGEMDDGLTYDKRLKTASSKRRVPLHQIVLDAGFDDYLAKLKASGQRALFPELHAEGKTKKTKNASRNFTRGVLKSIGLDDKSKVFHSFRHHFKDRCRDAEMREAVHDALTGHSNGSSGANYGNGVPLAVLKRNIDKLSFPGYEPVPRRTF